MLTEHLVTIRAACDALQARTLVFADELDRPPPEHLVTIRAACDALQARTLVFADELDRPPLPYTSWNVDAPAGQLSAAVADGRPCTRFTVSRSQPLNPQGRCKTEVGPRDQDKSTASYLRLPLGGRVRAEVELHLPATWLRYRHKFNLAEIHGDTAGRPPPVSLYLSGDRVALRVGTADAWSAQRPAGWAHLRLDALLSGDPAVAETDLRVDGQLVASVRGVANAVGLPYFKFGLYSPAWSDPERLTADLSGPVASEHVHYRRFRLWQV